MKTKEEMLLKEEEMILRKRRNTGKTEGKFPGKNGRRFRRVSTVVQRGKFLH